MDPRGDHAAMGKNVKAAAQRAQKKQQKDKKREQKKQADKQRRQLAAASAAVTPSGAHLHDFARRRRRPSDWEPATDGILGLARSRDVHPQVAARMVFEEAEDGETGLPEALWTLEKITDLGTTAILAGLTSRGVRPDEAAFVERARALGSAWKLAEELWAPALPEGASVHDRDFLGLAAYTMWKHWCSEVPSREQVIDLLTDGREAIEDDELAIATDRWLDAWDRIKPFLTPAQQTFEAAEEVLELDASLHSWIDNLTLVASNLAIEDAGVAARASRVLEEVLAQFTGEDHELRLNLSGDLGGLLFRAGRPVDGERLLRAMIAAYPDHAIGYVSLAEAWAESRADQERALALLQEAAARVKDGGDWDLEDRIDALRADLGRVPHAAK
jgi:tetratricopeptide (TPR) repeat protein